MIEKNITPQTENGKRNEWRIYVQTQIWKKTLRQQEKGIRRAYETVRQDAETGETVCAAGQWLYDNYYLMQQQLDIIKDEFPWPGIFAPTGRRSSAARFSACTGNFAA